MHLHFAGAIYFQLCNFIFLSYDLERTVYIGVPMREKSNDGALPFAPKMD